MGIAGSENQNEAATTTSEAKIRTTLPKSKLYDLPLQVYKIVVRQYNLHRLKD